MDRAKELRANATYSEKILWERIRNGQISGYIFNRQRSIRNYIVDFYCRDLKLALEVDGKTHMNEPAKEKDLLRDQILQDEKVSILRFDALIVLNCIEEVIKEIEKWIHDYEAIYGVPHYLQRKQRRISKNQGNQ